MSVREYFGITDDKAFTTLVVAGFTAIMIGAVMLIISILVVNSVWGAVNGTYGSGTVNNFANSTLFGTGASVMASIGQALTIGGVALIIVGVAIIVAVLLGMTTSSR
jgi:hypothetical protein